MTTTNYNIRLDQDLKDRSFSVLESYGLTPSQAIRLFLNQVADTNVTRNVIRRIVIAQTLLAYLFGAGILAVAINLVAGL